jgi:glycosyltransferase involved in cell wall biosynthesis
MKLSIVISAFNEEKNIGDCLASVQQLIQHDAEIIVVDNSSTDKTVAIAKQYTDRLLTRENNLMLNVNKNFGFSHAKGDWILSLDADERITPALTLEILEKITHVSEEVHGLLIPRKNIIFNKWIKHGIWSPDYQLRLFRRGKGKFPEKHVHELVAVTGNVEKLEEPMVHYNYTSIAQYLHKLDTIYTENEVTNIIQSGKKLHWVDAIRFPVNDFLKTFFLQQGYKDGLHGLMLSLLQAFYMLLVFGKVWEREGFKEHNSSLFLTEVTEELGKVKKDTAYWIFTAKISESTSAISRFYYKIVRKLL